MNELSSPTAPTTHASGLGERLRSLRLASGLTQTELAGERFSKEYVGQIERWEDTATKETVEWRPTAGRRRELPRQRRLGRRAESHRGGARTGRALSEAHRYDDAVEAFRQAREQIAATGSAGSCVRWRARAGRSPSAARFAMHYLLLQARRLTEGPQFSDVDRADALFRLGVCRYKLASVATAVALFDEASRSPRARHCPATCSAPTSSAGAPAAGAISATSRPRTRTSSARWSWRRRWTTGASSPTPTSRHRSSPSAWGTGCSPELCAAGEDALRGVERRAERQVA